MVQLQPILFLQSMATIEDGKLVIVQEGGPCKTKKVIAMVNGQLVIELINLDKNVKAKRFFKKE